jgi:hypothetical protein
MESVSIRPTARAAAGFAVLVISAWTAAAAAQATAPQPDATVPDGAADTGATSKDEEIARLKENDARMQQKLDELSAKLDEVTAAQDEALMNAAAPETENQLDIYGFFDVELFYLDTSDVESVDGLMVNDLSFMVNKLNLYFLAHMTETLSALAELRFTFLPNGYETSYAEPTFLGTSYQRTDTTVRDPFNQEEFQLGGVMIERAQFTWMPFEFLGVTAGRYLTPFGIWNVDHGSPVVTPINTPYFMSRQVLPLAQTGVQLQGRFIPRAKTYIDYAITLSNGRGPTQAFYDLDNNKALGGRLRLSYEGNDVKWALGGYLYWGDTTDVTKTIRYDVESESDYESYIQITDTEKYTEIVGTLDLSLDIYGVLFQSEFVRGQVKYDVRPVFMYPVIGVPDPFGGMQPDYNKWGTYGFLGYRIPLSVNQDDMSLTPFAMAEYYVFDDTFDDYTILSIRGGLNFKPSPFVTLKLEVNRVSFPLSKTNTGAMWLYAVQAAISF